MKNFITFVMMLMIFTFMALPALADGVRDANAAYNDCSRHSTANIPMNTQVHTLVLPTRNYVSC